MNEERTLSQLLQQLHRLPLHEIIAVINGSSDRSYQIASHTPYVKAIYYDHPLGHDVGRAVGAMASESDILIFLDGDILIQAEELLPFLQCLEEGNDIALNDLHPYLIPFHQRDGVSIVKEFLNRTLGRKDLSLNSLTAVPHALTRKAIDTIGIHHLFVPPKAQAIALMKGLKVKAVGGVDVFSKNKLREHNQGRGNPVADLIIGDHLEALKWVMDEAANPRLQYSDTIRKRDLIQAEV